MLNEQALKKWYWWHKWTSLICTLFLLNLCLTGLPLIFHHEIEELMGVTKASSNLSDNPPQISFNQIADVAQKSHPGKFIQFLFQEPGKENAIIVGMNDSPGSPFENGHRLILDTRTGEVLSQQGAREGFLAFMLSLHVDLFLGVPGKVFLGVMALLFLISMVSGVILYAPFMRDRSFAVVRRKGQPLAKWLDLHNGIGITLTVWALVVGATGMINTWADFALKIWQFTEMKAMIKENPPKSQEKPDPRRLASVQLAVDKAISSSPEMKFGFIAFPGNSFSSPYHYAVFLRGTTTLTERILKPVLIDAVSGEFTASRDMPWYIKTIFISQPLHFGDYGGLPLKILWAILDLATISILVSGLYLWNQKRKQPLELENRTKTNFIEAEHG